MSKYYSTTDIHIAATLMSVGHPLSGEPTREQLQFGNRPKARFHFEDSDKLREDVVAYTNGAILVNPRDLFSRLRELKSLVSAILS